MTVTTLVAVALWLSQGGLPASDVDEALATLSDSDHAASISLLADGMTMLDPSLTQLAESISPLEAETTQGEETVISLSSDVLFEFDRSAISETARKKIAELVADVPEGATVEIGGHTDSVSDEAYNQELSEKRAQAVADVLAQARPDLQLDVKGYGESQPVADNERGGEDHPEGRALNRRVEIRYEG
ncbi:OmpA family protein [Ornithinimicrobium tianjinense]|uniref:OmpA-like domain-containing protein n=1 Tax=Ornithinimicrobium tianjinense TaxID=1195761 RepID=A0A917BQV7_9MICO|nr:OmpA family protein [Ornithinimicrobium tianjinense]GGF55359.1 hypothetical protein GCM10011366_24090 [Ornithinimicrobium tianjinense]